MVSLGDTKEAEHSSPVAVPAEVWSDSETDVVGGLCSGECGRDEPERVFSGDGTPDELDADLMPKALAHALRCLRIFLSAVP